MTTGPTRTTTLIRHEDVSVSLLSPKHQMSFHLLLIIYQSDCRNLLDKRTPALWRVPPSSDIAICLRCSFTWLVKLSERETLFSHIFIIIAMWNCYKPCQQFLKHRH